MDNHNEIIEKYYETFYKDLHEWRDYDLTSKGFEEWYYDCLPMDKKAKILDIGCGDGKFLFFLTNKGYQNVEGLELSKQQAEEARKNVKYRIHEVGDANIFLKKSFDNYQMITMNDVLEHIPKKDMIKLLKNILAAIKPGGTLIVNVPQVAGLSSLFCRYVDFTHETIFTEMSLKQVLLSAGFSQVRFIPQKWPLKLTPRHLTYRIVRFIWYFILKIIYIIESPGEKHPSYFQDRLVAEAIRASIKNKKSVK